MTRDSVAGEVGGFVAGTRVRTKEGLKPIEEIEVGDWVLSQPEDRGELAYKRVKRTFCFEDKSVVLVRYVLQRDGEWIVGDSFIVTGNHPFWVEGFERSWFPEDLSWDVNEENRGWTRADSLRYGDIICLASGERAIVSTSSSLDKLWRTKRENVAWEAKAGDEVGHLVTIEDGANITFDTDLVLNDFFYEDDTFRYRDERPEWEEAWYYRCKVYNFEVEDFHTYYVGNFGVWVHNTNCFRTTVECLKAHGILLRAKEMGCFPAGTRVWTDNGLVPIEQIQVGDLVLSRPENGQGEQAYKRVAKAFSYEDKTLRRIVYEMDEGRRSIVYVTGNHPFWVVEEEVDYLDDDLPARRSVIGWTAAEDLQRWDHLVQLADGSYARVVENLPVYRTKVPGQGWCPYSEGWSEGCVHDFLTGETLANHVLEDQEITWGDDPYLKVRVYNIEVEDFHTYYVARGVWVHGASGFDA